MHVDSDSTITTETISLRNLSSFVTHQFRLFPSESLFHLFSSENRFILNNIYS